MITGERRFVGKVLRLNVEKGYGFIGGDDAGATQYFFHRRSMEGAVFDTLQPGQRVTFALGDVGRGPRAESVRLSTGND